MNPMHAPVTRAPAGNAPGTVWRADEPKVNLTDGTKGPMGSAEYAWREPQPRLRTVAYSTGSPAASQSLKPPR